MPAIAAGAAIVGAGVSVYGAISSAQSQADIDNQKAAIANQQADEVAGREIINDQQRQISANMLEAESGAVASGTGFAVSGVGSKLEIQRQTNVQIAMNDRDAAFQEQILREGGAMQTELAGITSASGYVTAGGTTLTTIGAAFNPNTGLGKAFSGPSQGLQNMGQGPVQ